MKFKVAINTSHKGKHPAGMSKKESDEWFREYNGRFRNRQVTATELAKSIQTGYAYTTHHKKYRKGENFTGGQHLAIDMDTEDERSTFSYLLDDPFITQYAAILHTTPSHTDEKPRCRVVFLLDQQVTNVEQYSLLAQALVFKYQIADSSAKDPCRLFYGAEGCELVTRDNVLPVDVAMEELAHPYQQHLENEKHKAEEAAKNRVVMSNGDAPDALLRAHSQSLLERVANAPDGEKHTTLRDIATTFGGYVASGYYDEFTVTGWLQDAIRANPNNVKDLDAAYLTIEKNLRYGMGKPLYFDAQEQQPDPFAVHVLYGRKPEYKVGDRVHPFIGGVLDHPATVVDIGEKNGVFFYGLDNGYAGKYPEYQLQPETSPNGQDPTPKEKYLLREKGDHEGHAQTVITRYGKRIFYTQARGWVWYNGKYWQTDAKAAVRLAIIDTLKARRKAAVDTGREDLVKTCRVTDTNVNGTMNILESFTTVDIELFDADPDYLNCANGVLDLRTGELSPHSYLQRFTYCLDVAYVPDADQTPWLDFLQSVLVTGENEKAQEYTRELIDYLQEAIGYTLTGHTWEEVMFYLHGPTRSGKGTFTEVLLKLLGWPLATGADFETFTARRDGDTQNFDLAPLKPCRFVSASESSKYTSMNEAKLKQLTGGDRIRCAFKRRDHFSYKPQFKIWLSSNHKVNVDVDDDAVWARVRVINFPNSFLGRENKMLKHDLTSIENLEGVLAWIVQGSRKWYEAKGGLIAPQTVMDTTKQHRDDLDYIHQFLIETYNDKTKEFIPNSEIYYDYKTWCDSNGYKPKYQNQFTRSLTNKGLVSVREYHAGKQTRGIKGMREYAIKHNEQDTKKTQDT